MDNEKRDREREIERGRGRGKQVSKDEVKSTKTGSSFDRAEKWKRSD